MGGNNTCKDCTPDKCCCCVDLEVGSNVIAGMNISAGFCVGFMVASGFGEVWEMKWCFIILAITSIIAGVSLLHGSIKRNKVTTAGYLGLSVINVVVCVIIAVNFFSGYDNENWNQFWGSWGYVWIMQGLVWVVTALLIIYLGICVFRFLIEIVSEASDEVEDMSTTTAEEGGEEEAEDDDEYKAEPEKETSQEEDGDAADGDKEANTNPPEDDVVLSSMSRRSSMYVVKL